MSAVLTAAPVTPVADTRKATAPADPADAAAFSSKLDSAHAELESAAQSVPDATSPPTTDAATAVPAPAALPTIPLPAAGIPAPAPAAAETTQAPAAAPVVPATAPVVLAPVAAQAPVGAAIPTPVPSAVTVPVLPKDTAPATMAPATMATATVVAASPDAQPVSHESDKPADSDPGASVQPDPALAVLPLIPQALPLAPTAPPASAAPLAGGTLSSAPPVTSRVGSAPAATSAPAAPADQAPAQQAEAPVATTTIWAPVAAPQVSAPAPVASVSVAAPVEVVPLAGQLSRPLLGLRSAGNGDHVMTINVTPDNLGPVVVRAHVSGDSVRIELIAPTDQAREAIKAIMPELRRDLSQTGGQTSLDLSSSGGRGGDGTFRDADAAPRRNEPERQSTGQATPRQRAIDSRLDVLA